MSKTRSIDVKGSAITIIRHLESDYISLTDMIKSFGDDTIIYNWLRNRNTIEFLGIWEQINNPAFNPLEFEGFKKQAGLNSFTLKFRKHQCHAHPPRPSSTAAPSATQSDGNSTNEIVVK